jgi:hypothetical protein
MNYRTLTGSVITADGRDIRNGEIRFRPISVMPISGTQTVFPQPGYATISDGVIAADQQIVGGVNYAFEVWARVDGVEVRLDTFNAGVPDAETSISYADIYSLAHTYVAPEGPPTGSGEGDMLKSVYDTNDDGKVNSAVVADTALAVEYANVQNKPTNYPTNIANVSGLATALTNKADLVGGVIPTAQLPALAIGETFVVNSEVAMLALAAQRGDVAKRTDTDPASIYWLTTDDPSVLSNWLLITVASGGAVDSVNGQTGVVVLDASDVGAEPLRLNPSVESFEAVQSDGVRIYIPTGQATTFYIDNYLPPLPTGEQTRNAIQQAINDAVAAGGGRIWGTRKYVTTGSTFQEVGGANCKLLLPAVEPISTHQFITLEFAGPQVPDKSYSVIYTGNASVPSQSGFIIEDTDSGGEAIIGATQVAQGYGASVTFGNWTLINAVFRDVLIRGANAAPLSAIDLRYAIMTDIRNLSIDVGVSSDIVADPRTNAKYALRPPRWGNGAWNQIEGLFVLGFANGLEMQEHVHLKSGAIMYCGNALRFRKANHASKIDRVLMQWNVRMLYSASNLIDGDYNGAIDGVHHTEIAQLDFENYDTGYFGSKWYNPESVVRDGDNNLRGNMSLFGGGAFLYIVGGSLGYTGGNLLNTTELKSATMMYKDGTITGGSGVLAAYGPTGQLYGAVYRQSVPATGNAVRFTLWLPAGLSELSIIGAKTVDSGIFTVTTYDGTTVRTIVNNEDWYAATETPNAIKRAEMVVSLSGALYVTFTVNSKNASSSNYYLNVSSFNVRRIA